MLKVEGFYCGYHGVDITRNINFSLQKGEKLCIIGANGSGKSTLLRGMMGLTQSRGECTLNEVSVAELSPKERARYLAFLSQTTGVVTSYSVRDTVAMGRYCHKKGVFSSLSKWESDFIDHCIQSVGLWDQREQSIACLSGGQVQRAFLARTFAQAPTVILLDEPTNHLDLKIQLELYDYLTAWTQEGEHALVAVLHDVNAVRGFADKVLLLDKGECLGFGKVDEVLTQPLLERAYEVDVWGYMQQSYQRWQ